MAEAEATAATPRAWWAIVENRMVMVSSHCVVGTSGSLTGDVGFGDDLGMPFELDGEEGLEKEEKGWRGSSSNMYPVLPSTAGERIRTIKKWY